MDRLEEHIRRNREDLDRYKPSSDTWKSINKRLNNGKSKNSHWISIAAMVIVIIGSAVIFYKSPNRISRTSITTYNEVNKQLNPELKEAEIYYNNLVNSLYKEATPLLTANPEMKKELAHDISQLDSICLDIRKDLKDNVANQEVVEALIQNYRVKIRLLEEMLIILKEDKDNLEKEKNYEL
jgi:hypothetical protein